MSESLHWPRGLHLTRKFWGLRCFKTPLGDGIAIGTSVRARLARGYGLADWADGRPVSAGNRFRVGSVSKPLAFKTVLEASRLAPFDSIGDRTAFFERQVPWRSRFTMGLEYRSERERVEFKA